MLEIFDRNPSSRVFHVDNECYVLYLGADWDDYKPFLRLGTSTELPENLPPIVSTIVVPDVLTGSPLDEAACLTGDATADTHYVGDVRTVNKLKKFIKLESIRVEGLRKADHETDDSRNVYVYSYRDGNLKIKYHKSEIFDLHRRERVDLHYTARAQAIKNDYGKGPFKLPGEVFQRNGFAVVSGVPYLVARGEMAALDLGEDYFAQLAAVGIDPDRIAVAHVPDVGESMLRYFKRCRAKNKVPRLATSSGAQAKALAGIFRANSLPALKIAVLDGDGSTFPFHRFSVTKGPNRFKAALPEMEGPLVLGTDPSPAGAAVAVDTSRSVVTLGGRKYPLIDGAIYQLDAATLSRTLITERYFPERNYPYRDMLGQAEAGLIDQITQFFSELFSGRDPSKVLKIIRGNTTVRDLGRAGGRNPVTDLIIANAVEYARYLAAAEPEAGKKAQGLASLLSRHNVDPVSVPGYLPVAAEISYHENEPYLFYRFVARITDDRVAHAERVVEKINAVPLVDFVAERKRLQELVDGLADPEQMEEARLKRIAERKKEAAEKKAAEQAEKNKEKEGAATADRSGPSGSTASGIRNAASRGGGSRGRGRGSSGGTWRWLAPVLVLVLLIIALLALLATGVIGDGWFGDKDGQDTEIDGGPDTVQRGDTPDGTSGGDGEGTGTGDGADGTGDGTSEAGSADGSQSTQPDLPEGWPPETLPAIRALEDAPGVVITSDRVIGPGGIEITVMDIISLVNQIAGENGYAEMHVIDPVKPDPDWIYPGNVFVLPNETRYTVVEGDTLWEITVRYMVARLAQDYELFVRLTGEYEESGTSAERRTAIAVELRTAGEESHSENFTRIVTEKLAEWVDS